MRHALVLCLLAPVPAMAAASMCERPPHSWVVAASHDATPPGAPATTPRLTGEGTGGPTASAAVAAGPLPSPASPGPRPGGSAPTAAAGPSPLPPQLAALPFVRHLAASGAAVRDLGEAFGMRGVGAVNGDEFRLFQVAPGGGAAVLGAVAHLAPEDLSALAPGGATELAPAGGLRGLFVRSGAAFQVFYVTPDGRRVVPGVLYDAAGRELTRAQIAGIPGALPTVVVGDGGTGSQVQPPPSPRPGPGPATAGVVAVGALATVEEAVRRGPAGAPEDGGEDGRPQGHAEFDGDERAPVLWMFADPRCGYSIRAVQALAPHVAAGRVRLGVLPVAVLDPLPGGQSARLAMALLSRPEGGASAALQSRVALASVPVAPDAARRLAQNMALAAAVRLTGTPTFLWRRADGGEGRADGLPDDAAALVASMGR